MKESSRNQAQSLPAARLCEIIQGVEFWMGPEDGQGELVRAVIAVEALKEHYGALDGPDSWLTAYETHQPEIERQARDLHRKAGRPAIVVIFEPALQDAG